MTAPAVRPPRNEVFLGNAMKALFDTAEVSIKRGDETRVITKHEQADAAAKPAAKRPAKPTADAEPLPELPPGLRPGPHVDLMLWLVLAAGLFAIAAWMLSHGL